MEQGLIKLDPKEFGLEENKAKQIADMFLPMLSEMETLEAEFNEVIKLPIEKETTEKAKGLRLKYVKVRTGTAKIHKDLKAFYLNGGRFVDGWKNAQVMASQGNEERLLEIEKHFEVQRQKEVEALQESRANKLNPFLEANQPTPPNLFDMDESMWNNYLTGAEANYKARVEAEEKAEAERIAKEKAEIEEQERIRKENEQLKKEAEERERLQKIKDDEQTKIESDRLAKEESARKVRVKRDGELRPYIVLIRDYGKTLALPESEYKKELVELKKAYIAEKEYKEGLEKEAEEEREQLKKERDKLEAQIKAKKEAEEKAKADGKAKEQMELSKGDSAKVKDLITAISGIKTKFEFKSAKNRKMYQDVQNLLDKVIAHIG